MAVIHKLKSWVGLFEPINNGEKTHDLRVMDRNYQVGDICMLCEYDPMTRLYTNRVVHVMVTYITSEKHSACAFSPVALHPAMAVLSIRRLTAEENHHLEGDK